jgi:hypothetical protein
MLYILGKHSPESIEFAPGVWRYATKPIKEKKSDSETYNRIAYRAHP